MATNPFDSANMAHGGGIWDGKTITVTGAKAVDRPIIRGDGTAYLNRDGTPSHFRGLEITAIADDEDVERRQGYSAGYVGPTEDGEGFVSLKDGAPAKFHIDSQVGQFASRIKAQGFPVDRLWVDGKMRLSGLIGARFRMEGIHRTSTSGEVKKNARGFTVYDFWPVEFLGFKEGVIPTTAPVSDTLREKAKATVLAVLTEAGGSVPRTTLVRGVAAKLTGDPEANKVLALISRDEFHRGAPWTRDGTSYKLTQ